MIRRRDRTVRAGLQQTFGELADVQPYHYQVDFEHPLVGWWVTPIIAADGCGCALCEAARDRRDVHLGSISRTAHYEAGRIVAEHLSAAA